MSIPLLINLYRRSGSPSISGLRFEGELSFSQSNRDLIQALREQAEKRLLRFEELSVDGNEILDGEDFPLKGECISFHVMTPQTGTGGFYNSIKDMIQDCQVSLSKGDLPNDFYIIDIDYSSADNATKKTSELIKLEKICKFIKQLSELAHYHDAKKMNGYHKLVFITPGDAKNQAPEVIETKIDYSLLADEWFPDLTILDELSLAAHQPGLHYTEKKNIFYSSLVEFLASLKVNPTEYFKYLINRWNDFSTIYQNNLSTYLSGFTFHKARKEVAEAELKLAEDFSKVLSDMTGKLLSIPLSFVFVVSIANSTSSLGSFCLMTGLLITSSIIAVSVYNQDRQFEKIKNAKQLIFDSLKGKEENYPDDLKETIMQMKGKLEDDESRLASTLSFYRIVCWIPTFFGLAIYWQKFG